MPLKTIPQNLTWISSQLSLFFHSFSPQLLDQQLHRPWGKSLDFLSAESTRPHGSHGVVC